MMMKKVKAMKKWGWRKRKIEHEQLNKDQPSSGEMICGSVSINDNNNSSTNNNTSIKQYINDKSGNE